MVSIGLLNANQIDNATSIKALMIFIVFFDSNLFYCLPDDPFKLDRRTVI